MATVVTVKLSKALRTKVAKASEGLPSVQVWLDRIAALDVPLLTEAIEGIWTGRNGEVRLDLPGAKSLLCMGWYHGRVEWSYLS